MFPQHMALWSKVQKKNYKPKVSVQNIQFYLLCVFKIKGVTLLGSYTLVSVPNTLFTLTNIKEPHLPTLTLVKPPNIIIPKTPVVL